MKMEVTRFPLGESLRCGGEPTDLVRGLRFYGRVPKELKKNLKFRRNVLDSAVGEPKVQKRLVEACRRDPLFWLNGFCWLYEPRFKHAMIPFLTWKHQDIAFMAMREALGVRDVLVDKSRGEGASWMVLML